MLKKPKIGAIVFYVKDIRRSEKFYRDTLGLAVRVSSGDDNAEHPGEAFMTAQCGDCTLVFFEKNEAPGKTPVVVFELDEGGIDDVVAQLAGKGAQIVTPVSEAPGGWSANFVDPDQHMLSFYQYNTLPRTLNK